MTATDTTKTAQNRFVVSLPADTRTQIEAIGKNLTKALEEQTGVAIELSPAQIVQSLVRQAHDLQDELDSEPAAAAA
jgi:ABC-type phosphate/phosphonate transport system substrate-binding protein